MNDFEKAKAMQCWPGGWPGRQVVDLDNVGDAGFWLEEHMADLEDALAGNDEALIEAAEILAEAYSDSAAALSFPVPSDFECSKQDELQMIAEDFRGFLREWRRRVIAEKKCEG